jgi:hypothetical protein
MNSHVYLKSEVLIVPPENVTKKRKLESEETENTEPAKKPHLTVELAQKQSSPLQNTSKTSAAVPPFHSALMPFETCLIGTSMIRNIRSADLFPTKKCFFKSINGGLIEHVDSYLRAREGFFDHCHTFVLTCGSNDCDSKNEINETVAAYYALCWYLHLKYPTARLVLNTLVPRQHTRFTTPAEFEKRRKQFNQFLVANISGVIWNARVVFHPEFEDRESLDTLLSDGVHLSIDRGVLVYVEEINGVLRSIF